MTCAQDCPQGVNTTGEWRSKEEATTHRKQPQQQRHQTGKMMTMEIQVEDVVMWMDGGSKKKVMTIHDEERTEH